MSFASTFNKGSRFTIDTTGFEYIKASDLVAEIGMDGVYRVAGLYINTKGNYADHPVVILPDLGKMVDLPEHMTAVCRDILASDEACADIIDGKVGISFEAYHSKKFNRDCIGCRWVDIK